MIKVFKVISVFFGWDVWSRSACRVAPRSDRSKGCRWFVGVWTLLGLKIAEFLLFFLFVFDFLIVILNFQIDISVTFAGIVLAHFLRFINHFLATETRGRRWWCPSPSKDPGSPLSNQGRVLIFVEDFHFFSANLGCSGGLYQYLCRFYFD